MSANHANAVRYGTVAASVVWVVGLHVSGVQLDSTVQRFLGYLPTATALFTVAFDKWIWRWPFIQPLVGRPRVDGTWRTTITPSTRSHIPTGGNRGPITGAVIIEQSYWTLSVRLLTPESSSMSDTAALRPIESSGNQRLLTYTYRNEPKQEHRHRSPVHHGASEFAVTGRLPRVLTGTYWTDRLTTGDMQLTLVDRRTDRASLSDVPTG